jgi:hypothetical protein
MDSKEEDSSQTGRILLIFSRNFVVLMNSVCQQKVAPPIREISLLDLKVDNIMWNCKPY